jgi:hypothetical protein
MEFWREIQVKIGDDSGMIAHHCLFLAVLYRNMKRSLNDLV